MRDLAFCARAAALVVCTMLAIAMGFPASAAGRLTAGSGEPAPPLALRDLDGGEVRLDKYRGRTVVVNFWATWCAPCVAEMPSLVRLRAKLSPAGVEVLGVNLQENAARIRPFAQRLGLDFPILRDHDGAVTKAWGARVFPTTFVVGPDQRIALVAIGDIDWDAPEVEARIRAVAGKPGATPPSRRATLSTPASFLEHMTWIDATS
jgi:peroxiredoxin